MRETLTSGVIRRRRRRPPPPRHHRRHRRRRRPTGFSRSAFLSFIHAQRPTTHLEAIGLLDGVLRFTGSHVDECKSARTPGFPIVDEFDGFDFAVALEDRTHFVFGRGEWQVANVDRRHSTVLTDWCVSRGYPTRTRFQHPRHPRESQRRGSVPSAVH